MNTRTKPAWRAVTYKASKARAQERTFGWFQTREAAEAFAAKCNAEGVPA